MSLVLNTKCWCSGQGTPDFLSGRGLSVQGSLPEWSVCIHQFRVTGLWSWGGVYWGQGPHTGESPSPCLHQGLTLTSLFWAQFSCLHIGNPKPNCTGRLWSDDEMLRVKMSSKSQSRSIQVKDRPQLLHLEGDAMFYVLQITNFCGQWARLLQNCPYETLYLEI